MKIVYGGMVKSYRERLEEVRGHIEDLLFPGTDLVIRRDSLEQGVKGKFHE